METFTAFPLAVVVRGEVSSSNVSEFRQMVREALLGINRDLKTDEDLGQAELDIKSLKSAEDNVRSAKEKALSDAEQLHALFSELDATAEEIRAPRLELEKLISTRKEELKKAMIQQFLGQIICEPRLRASTFGMVLQTVIKGKRTLDSMRRALEIAVTTANGVINKNRIAIDYFIVDHGAELVPDKGELELKSTEFVEGELRRRAEAKQAEIEKRRLQQEADKARAEVALVKSGKNPGEDSPFIGGSSVSASLPTPPKIDGLPTVKAEWEAFKSQVLSTLGALRPVRLALRHNDNREKADRFAQACAEAARKEGLLP